MTTYTYEAVKWYGYKRGKCVVCGKTAERSRVFSQTLNPFNKDAEGCVKSRAQINAENAENARAWQAEPVLHARCEDGAA